MMNVLRAAAPWAFAGFVAAMMVSMFTMVETPAYKPTPVIQTQTSAFQGGSLPSGNLPAAALFAVEKPSVGSVSTLTGPGTVPETTPGLMVQESQPTTVSQPVQKPQPQPQPQQPQAQPPQVRPDPPKAVPPPPTAAPPPSEQPSSMVCNGLNIQDVAFAIIAGREVYVQEVQRTWMTLVPSAAVYMTTKVRPGKRTNKPHDFTQAMSRLKAKFPNAKWYVLSDDDVFFSVHNLLCLLGGKDSTQPHFIGTHHCQGEGFKCQRRKPIMSTLKGWTNGGAGIVISAALAAKMDTRQCTSYYAAHWHYGQVAADVVLSCCVADSWPGGKITHHPGFFRNPPNRQYECECRGRCTMTNQQVRTQPDNVISYHHVSTVQIRNLYKADLARYKTLYDTAQHIAGNRVSELF